MPDDAELLRRYAEERSEAAFTELVERNLGLVYATALRQLSGNVHHAQDVAQAVFTALARNAASVARHPVLIGWLYTTTQHLAAKVRRAEGRRSAREQAAHLMHELTSPGSPAADWAQLRPILDDAMRDLNDRDREAVLLRFFARRPFAEIGAILRLSEDAARMRVERALEKLRASLTKHQITSTTAALTLALANQPAVALPADFAAGVASTALTSVNVVTTPAVSIFQIMSSSKIAVGVAGFVLVFAFGIATREYSQRNAADAALAAANLEYAAELSKQRKLEQRAKTAEEEVARLKQMAEEVRAAQAAARTQTAAEASAGKAEPPWDPKAEGQAFLARHAETKQALDDYVGASQRFQYAPMYRALGFSPEQIRRWEALNGAGTTMGASLGNGRDVSLPYPARPAGLNRDQQMREMLGAEWPQRLEEFGSIAAARGVAADVAGSLYFTDTPLAADQIDRLLRILVESQNTGPAARVSAYDWNAVIAKAEGVLAAPQVAVLSAKRATDQFHHALNRPRAPAATPVSGGASPGK